MYNFGYSDLAAKISLNLMLLISAIMLLVSEFPMFQFPANQVRRAIAASNNASR